MRRLFLLLLVSGCAGENLTHPETPAPYEPVPGETPACLPDLDGRIDAAEMPLTFGMPVHFRVNAAGEERTVDLVGDEDGWDWSYHAPSDALFTMEPAPLAGLWFEESFPGGQFVLPVDPAASVLGVYSRSNAAIRLHGVASAVEQPASGKTLLPYEDPIDLYRFPIEPGAEWTVTGTIYGGTWNGIPYGGWDEYQVRVDAVGRLELPELAFEEAHRVRTNVTVQPAYGYATSRKLVSWMFECFGEVARAQSRLDEDDDDFTVATEVRRLGIMPPE